MVRVRCTQSFGGFDIETGTEIYGYPGVELLLSPLSATDLVRANCVEVIEEPEPAPEPTATDETEAETEPAPADGDKSVSEEPTPEPTAKPAKKPVKVKA